MQERYGVDFTKGIPRRIVQICKDKKFEECEKELKNFLESPFRIKLIKISLKAFNDAWNKINKVFFIRLARIMKKPICSEKFTAYLTNATRCPYNPDKEDPHFFVNFFRSIPHVLENVAHEIMHIQFYNAYQHDIEKQIGKEKTSDLKEALTVLLNLEFKDLWLVYDEGYPIHKELREFISSEWKKQPDFDNLIKKCVVHLKE